MSFLLGYLVDNYINGSWFVMLRGSWMKKSIVLLVVLMLSVISVSAATYTVDCPAQVNAGGEFECTVGVEPEGSGSGTGNFVLELPIGFSFVLPENVVVGSRLNVDLQNDGAGVFYPLGIFEGDNQFGATIQFQIASSSPIQGDLVRIPIRAGQIARTNPVIVKIQRGEFPPGTSATPGRAEITFNGLDLNEAIPVSSCAGPEGGWIEGAKYYLDRSLQSDDGSCLRIYDVDDVSLDCVDVNGGVHSIRSNMEVTSISKHRGISVVSSDGAEISNCLIQGFSAGIYLQRANDVTIDNAELLSNGYGIRSNSLSTSSRVTINNSRALQSVYTGISLERGKAHIIENTVVLESGRSGISLLDGASDSIIRNNRIEDNVGSGLSFDYNTAYRVLIEENTICNNGDHAAQGLRSYDLVCGSLKNPVGGDGASLRNSLGYLSECGASWPMLGEHYTLCEGMSQEDLDADLDGVFDEADQCPGTAEGEIVDSNGCEFYDANGDGRVCSEDFELFGVGGSLANPLFWNMGRANLARINVFMGGLHTSYSGEACE